MIYARVKSLEWLEKHAFIDHDADFWETEEARDYYDKYHFDKDVTLLEIYKGNAGKIISIHEEDYSDNAMWFIEKLLPPETNSELYI